MVKDKQTSNKIEKLFNEAFYLINSVDIERKAKNYCSLIEQDPKYIQNKKFRYWAQDYNHYKKAIDLFSKIIEIDSNYYLAYNFSGVAKYKIEKYEDAVADFTKAIEIIPTYAESYYRRGIIFADSWYDDSDRAIADFTKAIENDPKYKDAYISRAKAKTNNYEYEKDYEGAIADYTKAIELDPNNMFLYNNRGEIKRYINDYRGAIDDFTKAIEIDWYFSSAFYNRAIAKEKIGDSESAKNDMTMYHSLTKGK